MVSALISRVLILTVGTLYPAYKSYKGVKSRNVREYVKWMMYWIIFALYLCVEALTDIFVAFWLPLYYEIKIIFVIWLLSPYTKGASLLYRKFVHPFLLKHEKEIDLYLEQAKRESYARVVKLGNKGINYAKEAVATAALKSHEHIVGQIRKTVSLNDVNEPQLDKNRLQQNALEYDRVEEDEVDGFDLPPGVTVTSSLRVKRSKTTKQRPALSDMRRLKAQNGTLENLDHSDHPIIHETDELASSLIEQEFSYLQDSNLEDENDDVEEEEETKHDPDYVDITSDSVQSQKTKTKKSGGNYAATLPRRSQRKVMKRE